MTSEKIGKIDLDAFERIVAGKFGKPDPAVLVAPQTGVDAGVIDLGDGRVLIVAEDPIFPAPNQSLAMFGWYTVHIGASDVAVMGVAPQYLTYSLLLPPATPERDIEEIVDSVHRTAEELGIAIVGGHTGYYPSTVTPLIGGITVFAVAPADGYVTPAGAKPGNDVLLTKGPAIEAAGLLSVLYEDKLREEHDDALVDAAMARCRDMTVVADALTAMEAGGVSAMHDATEGGVIGGLFEVAAASDVGMDVDESAFVYPDEVKMVCEALAIDSVAAIAEGSLIVTCESEATDAILAALKNKGIEGSVIGSVTDDVKTRTLTRRDGSTAPLAIPRQDPFWPAFFAGLEQSQ